MENVIAIGSFIIAIIGAVMGVGAFVIQWRSSSASLARTYQQIDSDQAVEIAELCKRSDLDRETIKSLQEQVAKLQIIADETAVLHQKISELEMKLSEVEEKSRLQAIEIERLNERVKTLEVETTLYSSKTDNCARRTGS